MCCSPRRPVSRDCDRTHIEVEGDCARYATHFDSAIRDKAIAAVAYMTRHRWFVRYGPEKSDIVEQGDTGPRPATPLVS